MSLLILWFYGSVITVEVTSVTFLRVKAWVIFHECSWGWPGAKSQQVHTPEPRGVPRLKKKPFSEKS